MVRGKVMPVPKPASIVMNTSIHNRFDIEVVDAKTKKVKQRARAYNVVCQGLWTAMNRSFSVEYHTGWFNSIAYGTGTGTPFETDTALFNQINKMTGLHETYGVDHENSCIWVRKDISITELMNVGETLTEMGIVDSAGILCTHAMLQDMNGNQISIEKTDTDIVNIYATIFVHFPAELLDVNNSIQVSLYSMRNPRSILRIISGHHGTNYPNFSDHVRFIPSKGRVFPLSVSSNEKVNTLLVPTTAFDVNARTITFRGRVAAVNNNIAGGFGWIVMHGSSNFNYTGYHSDAIILKAIPPVFSGSKVVGEAIGTGDGTTVDFATKFDFPENAKIYVDGVLQQNVTVDCVPLSYNHMGKYFEAIDFDSNGNIYPKLTLYGARMDNLSENSDIIGEINVSETVFYNPYYQYGIKSFGFEAWGEVSMSDDLENWVTVSRADPHTQGTYNVPEAYRNYKYFKVVGTQGSTNYDNMLKNLVSNTLTGKNIHFATPPAAGAVITADYDTAVVTKDSNHVFDLELVIQLNEYIET